MMKVSGSTWNNGTALHYVLSNAEIRRFNLVWLLQYPLLLNLMTYGALLLELALPFLLWVRAARPWVMLAGLGLHFAIGITINIPIFGELMTATYLTFLLPEELDSVLLRLDPRRWFRRGARAEEAGAPQASIVRPIHGAADLPAPHWAGAGEFGPAGTGDAEEAEVEPAGV